MKTSSGKVSSYQEDLVKATVFEEIIEILFL